ncbi:hypothetical protein A0H81_10097, partial [Grifola frondosa]
VLPLRLPAPKVISSFIRLTLVVLRVVPPHISFVERLYLHLNYITVPLISVLILLATGAINGTVVRNGIVGADGIKPLEIMALFISLAYLSISLDTTGLLRYAALWVAQKGRSSGPKLYFNLYTFFLLCGVLVGNDPVILSGTAFLAYFTRVSGLTVECNSILSINSITPPTAWIFAQFAAANMAKNAQAALTSTMFIASVVLVSSNPTNLVLSGAFSLSFTTYTAHVILPFIGAALCIYPVLSLVLFRSPGLIPPSIDLDMDGDSGISTTLVDKRGAIFGSILILITLGAIGVPVWEVTVPPAIIMLIRDVHHDWPTIGVHLRGKPFFSYITVCSRDTPTQGPKTLSEPTIELHEFPIECDTSPPYPTTLDTILMRFLRVISSTFPTATTVIARLPFALIPFAFLMFILVQGLSTKGWVEIFAHWWAAWVNRTGTLGAVGGMGFISCMLCNFCGTNIGATILLARVLQIWRSSAASGGMTLDPRTVDGAIYALALGSNFGAFTLTFCASLAGLLWRQILHQKGIHVRPKEFLRLNLPISFTAMLVSSGILTAQIFIAHRHK